MKKRLAAMFLCIFLFQSTAALCESNDLEGQILKALFPFAYGGGFNSTSFDNIYYREPEPSLRELSELVIYPDEEKDVYISASTAGSIDRDFLSCNEGFMFFGGSGGWSYVNARCYPDHDDVSENLFLYIGLCVQGRENQVIGTPELVIRLKKRDRTMPISVKKLEIEITKQRRYTFDNAVQQNDNCVFYLGNTGKQLIQDLAKDYGVTAEPDILFNIYFDSLYFMGSDLNDYPKSIADYLKSGKPYMAGDKLDYGFPLVDMAMNLAQCNIYDCIDKDVLQNADTQHNAVIEDITDPV
jgi:hypothetical protein